MIIYNKVRAVEKVFHELDDSIRRFQVKTGLRCVKGCGKCCFKPDVEATILEFLPLAYHYFREGKATRLFYELQADNSPVCRILHPLVPSGSTGFCSDYKHRGMICRLFGFSARRSKTGDLELFTCRYIKENQPDEFRYASENINKKIRIPAVSDYYMRLRMIDPDLGGRTYPVNRAILKALDVVINYHYYRNFRGKGYRKSS